jgi:DNA-binding HxlR family transcriptional regulator
MQVTDIYNELCPSRVVLDIISNKWVILIIEALAKKNQRFGELKKVIGGISAKVLSQDLKLLEVHHLIIRTDHSGIILNMLYLP